MVRVFSQINNTGLRISISSIPEVEVTITDPESFYKAKPILQPIFEEPDGYYFQNSSSINWADSETDNQFVIDLVEWIYHDGEKPKVLEEYEESKLV